LTNRPAFTSDEELIKQLQTVLRAAVGDAPQGRGDSLVRNARGLAEEISGRIHREPVKWGLANVPGALRDDAAQDAFTALLLAIPEMRGRQSVAEWFSLTVESKFRRLWSLSERQSAEREHLLLEAAAAPKPAAKPADSEPLPVLSLFEEPDGVWAQFELAFPRDAFALRLRYLLRRELTEMAVMLDAPSSRAITMRLDRARDRFRMYSEQLGVTRKDVASMMEQFSEVHTP
jgi:DNA-directed RNA polymerase specialized sigma24 family protein